MKVEEIKSLHGITPQAWRRLEAFLESVRVGQPIDYVTPFFPKGKRNQGLAYAQELLPMSLSAVQELNEIEVSEAKKFGPFSIRLPWEERRGGVLEYFSQKVVKSSISLRKAFVEVSKLLPAHSLHSLTIEEAFNKSPKGKNLGLPMFTSDRKFEKDYLLRSKSISAGWKDKIYPAVLGWRGQPNGTSKPKQRVVAMMDHAETYISTSIIQPLLSALRSKEGFAAWNSLDNVNLKITKLIDRSVAPILSVDFSGYDRTLPYTNIHLGFELIRYWFKGEDKPKIDWMEEQFLTVGLVTPDGIYTGRDGGVPSGDGATNMIDSLVQILTLRAMCIDLGYTLRNIEVLGDDGVYSFEQLVDVEAISAYYYDLYGMKVSAEKGGFSSESVLFLQRLHSRKYRKHGVCVGMRSIMRTLNGIMHLERLHRGLAPEFFSARAIMQAENAKDHPNFPRLVTFLFKHDVYLRSLDPEEIFSRAGGIEKVEEVLGLKSFRFGNELPSSGLGQFKTVRLLRMMRRSSQHPT